MRTPARRPAARVAAAAAVVLGLALGACGGSSDGPRDRVVETLEEGGLGETAAECVTDRLIDQLGEDEVTEAFADPDSPASDELDAATASAIADCAASP